MRGARVKALRRLCPSSLTNIGFRQIKRAYKRGEDPRIVVERLRAEDADRRSRPPTIPQSWVERQREAARIRRKLQGRDAVGRRIGTKLKRDRAGRVVPEPPDHFADQKEVVKTLTGGGWMGAAELARYTEHGSVAHTSNLLNALFRKGVLRRERSIGSGGGDLYTRKI